MTQRSVDERLNELEARQAFQDDAVQALSDVLAQQQQRIAALEKTVERLIEQLNERSDDTEADEEPPPHY
jgi:SlyX protein